MKTERNVAKEAFKVQLIDVRITWVSDDRYPITKSLIRTPVTVNRTPVIDLADYVTNRRKTNNDLELCYIYN